MSNAIATMNGVKALKAQKARDAAEVMHDLIVKGDLDQMQPAERATYYVKVCETVGLNPLTKPFDLIKLNGKLTLYANKGCTDQLRGLRNITMRIVDRQQLDDLYIVTAEASTPDGRTDSDIGVVPVGGLKGESLANALMKATTKAKRRVTLSLVGLGMLDESEIESIPRERRQAVTFDVESGDVSYEPPPAAIAPPRGSQPSAGAERHNDHKRAMSHYHAACADAGIADAARHLIAVGTCHTQANGTKTTSTNQLTVAQLDDLARLIKADAGAARVDEDGAITVAVPVEYANNIVAAASEPALAEIGKEMGQAGIGNAWLRGAYKARLAELRAAPTPLMDAPAAPHPGAAGEDRWTQ